MNLSELNKIARAMVAPGRGILAADESSGTIKKRFDAIGAECTEDTRRDYREMLFRSTEAMSKYVSGVILYDETIRQKAKDGTPLVKIIEHEAGQTLADEIVGTIALLFLASAVLSYFAIRNPRRPVLNLWLERVADGGFLLGLLAIAALTVLFAYGLV